MRKFFKLKENKTTITTEVFAGVTTFMTMVYILAVNPQIMGDIGLDKGAVFTVTVLASVVGTLAMALLANYPFALAPGMGLNAFFAYTIALNFGWPIALLAVFVEGVVFLLLSFVNVRELLFEVIPHNLKHAVGVGIGFFISFIGFKNAGLVVASPATTVTMGNIKDVTVLLALFGLLLSTFLFIKKVRGSLFWGILITYGLGIIAQLTGLYVVNPELGNFSLLPQGRILGVIDLPPAFGHITLFKALKQIDFSTFQWLNFLVVVFSLLLVDIFDTIGSLIAASSKAGFMDKDGKLPRIKQAFLADAIGTTAGAMMGASTVTTYVESATGVAEGGRTGLASVVTAALFLLALFFFPVFGSLPTFATAPALIIVGLFMTQSIVHINFDDFTEALPAFLIIVLIPFTYSISDGIVFGILSYVILKILSGQGKRIHIALYCVAVLFLAKLIFRS